MGKKRGVRAEIIAGSPDSASKSCKRSREGKKKKKKSQRCDHRQSRTTSTLHAKHGRCKGRTNCNCSAESVKPEIWGKGARGEEGGWWGGG